MATYGPMMVVDQNGNPNPGAAVTLHASTDTSYSTPLTVTDKKTGNLLAPVTASMRGIVGEVDVADSDEPFLWIKSDDPAVPVQRILSWDSLQAIKAAAVAAETLAAGVAGDATEALTTATAAASSAATAEAAAVALAPDGGAKAVGKGELVVNVRDFGAVGDGVADDTAAVQAALDSGAGAVLLPPGTYRITSITVPSDTRLFGLGRPTVVGTSAPMIQVVGTTGAEVALGADATSGAQSLTTAEAHGLTAEDYLFLMSQRSSLVADAGEEWRLGRATPGAPGAYFGEWNQVREATSSTVVTLRDPILFPDYFMDATRETDVTARPAATVRKVTPARNVIIEGLRLRPEGAETATAIRVSWAVHCRIVDVVFDMKRDSPAVEFRNSLLSEAEKCAAEYDPLDKAETLLYQRNAFKVLSSQQVGFRSCSVMNGSQNFDLTYGPSGLDGACSTFNYVIDCETVGAQDDAATSHGGTFAARFLNNHFQCERGGIRVRGRSTVISGNVLSGGHQPDGLGISLYEGWARDCAVTGNSVSGFASGIAIRDGGAADGTFTWVGANISGNTITDVVNGVIQFKDVSNPSTHETPTGVMVNSNLIRLRTGVVGHGVYIPANTGAWHITDNTVSQGGTVVVNSHGIRAEEGADRTYVAGNSFVNVYYGIRFLATAFPIYVYILDQHWPSGPPNNARRLSTGTNINVSRTRAFDGPVQVARAASPGTATGTDASVINAVVTALRTYGIVT